MGSNRFIDFACDKADWVKKRWQRPSFSTMSTIVSEQQEFPPVRKDNGEEQPVKHESSVIRQKFCVFGKKATLTELNNKCLEEDTKVIKQLHTHSNKSPKKSVRFNTIFIERICYFSKDQAPINLKEVKNHHFLQLVCTDWPATTSNILLNNKDFTLSSDNSHIHGKVMIPNLALDRSVMIRYTLDDWTTTNEVDANFFGPYTKNTEYDTYEVIMDLNKQLADRNNIHAELEFTVHFTIGSIDYWDNNDNKNYKIEVISNPFESHLKEQVLEDDDISEETLEDYQYTKLYYSNEQVLEDDDISEETLEDYQYTKLYYSNLYMY